MIWLAMLMPVLAVIAMRVFFARKMAWWEFSLPLAGCALMILIGQALAEKIEVTTTEYWGGYLTRATYYEPWDEEVPCRHAKYHTETYECGTTQSPASCTHEVFDGYEHTYDVDYHPEHWTVHDSNDEDWEIAQSEYDYYVRKWHSHEYVDMNRSFHSIDGDAYAAYWPNSLETLQYTTTEHKYENRVAHSRSTYSYPEVDPKKTPVFKYPRINNGSYQDVCSQHSVLAKSTWPGSEEIDKINAILGASKKVRVWILIWEGDVDRQVAYDQEAYWKGSNKNEIVICINVDNVRDANVKWCQVFSWSKSESLKETIVGAVSIDNTKLDLNKLASWLKPEIQEKWEKRNWHEFDYLTVEPPVWATWTIWILTVLLAGGICFWCVTNEFEDSRQSRPF